MKLTCVTATFNAIKAGNRDKLIRCVKSIAALKTEHEHLIYDGASTDGTTELLKELESVTPGLVVVSEKDTGLYNALNKGVRDAKGEWFYVLGCDDYIANAEAFDSLLSEMPNADLVASPTCVEHPDGLRLGGWKRRRFFIGMPYSHQGTLMKTLTIRKLGGFNERHKIAGDYDLIVRFHMLAKKIAFTGEPYAVFSPGGMSTNSATASISGLDVIIENFGLDGEDAECYRKKLQLPWVFMFKELFNRDSTIRLSALAMMIRKVLK